MATDEKQNEPVQIIGMVHAKWLKVDEPEPGFLVQLEGETTSMSTFMTNEAMVKLMEWASAQLKADFDNAVAEGERIKKETVQH